MDVAHDACAMSFFGEDTGDTASFETGQGLDALVPCSEFGWDGDGGVGGWGGIGVVALRGGGLQDTGVLLYVGVRRAVFGVCGRNMLFIFGGSSGDFDSRVVGHDVNGHDWVMFSQQYQNLHTRKVLKDWREGGDEFCIHYSRNK